jgi:hypothetical protein
MYDTKAPALWEARSVILAGISRGPSDPNVTHTIHSRVHVLTLCWKRLHVNAVDRRMLGAHMLEEYVGLIGVPQLAPACRGLRAETLAAQGPWAVGSISARVLRAAESLSTSWRKPQYGRRSG